MGVKYEQKVETVVIGPKHTSLEDSIGQVMVERGPNYSDHSKECPQTKMLKEERFFLVGQQAPTNDQADRP